MALRTGRIILYATGMQKLWLFPLFLVMLSACSPAASPNPTAAVTASLPAAESTATPFLVTTLVATQAENGNCALKPVIAPTMPAKIPHINELDETTGLHMTGQVQVIDLASYRLQVSGKVDRPLSLTYEALRCMPKVTARPLLVCPGVFDDSATWSGVPIKDVLERAGVQAGAAKVALKSADGFEVSITLADALDPDNYLAYEWEGQPLPILHGFPLRAVFPGMAGGRWIKWLVELIVE